jgi:hypothetical protein
VLIGARYCDEGESQGRFIAGDGYSLVPKQTEPIHGNNAVAGEAGSVIGGVIALVSQNRLRRDCEQLYDQIQGSHLHIP